MQIYSRVRLLTCYYGWGLGLSGFILWALYEVSKSDSDKGSAFFGVSFIGCVAIILLALIDLHYSKVVNYYAAEQPKRLKRKESDKSKKSKEKEDLKKKSELRLDEEVGDDGMKNHVIVPGSKHYNDDDDSDQSDKEEKRPKKSKTRKSTKKKRSKRIDPEDFDSLEDQSPAKNKTND